MLRDYSFFKVNLRNIEIHSATCSCIIELFDYKRSCNTFVDFWLNWEFSWGFLFLSIILLEERLSCYWRGEARSARLCVSMSLKRRGRAANR